MKKECYFRKNDKERSPIGDLTRGVVRFLKVIITLKPRNNRGRFNEQKSHWDLCCTFLVDKSGN